jgi:signal transduction histidine kinase
VARGRLELAQETPARVQTEESPHLDTLDSALEGMEAIIDDVLTLAWEGRSIGETGPVELATNARAAWRHVETGRATLVVADDVTVEADRDRLLQLFEKLFRNAVEHAAPGEEVTHPATPANDGEDTAALTVTVGFDDVLYVADDDEGVPGDERDAVFKMGYTTSRDGTGFGLSMLTQIVDAHGWAVDVAEGSEQGARFEFSGVEVAE